MERSINQLKMQKGASEKALKEMQKAIGMSLPEDYLEFMRRSNGAVGHGPDLFAIFEPVEKIFDTTKGYGATGEWTGLIVIGGDGCGNIIGIDGRSHDPHKMDYVVLDPIWLDLDSKSCQHRSMTFQGILDYLRTRS